MPAGSFRSADPSAMAERGMAVTVSGTASGRPDSTERAAVPASSQIVGPRSRLAMGAVVVAAFGAFLAFMDSTVVNVAFPSIQMAFPHASVSTLSWVRVWGRSEGGSARRRLVAGRPLLQSPHISVRIREVCVEDPTHVVDVADFDAPIDQRAPSRSHVIHNEMYTL